MKIQLMQVILNAASKTLVNLAKLKFKPSIQILLTATVTITPSGEFLLLENGDFLLLESGDKIIL